jgi:hypothetical protein
MRRNPPLLLGIEQGAKHRFSDGVLLREEALHHCAPRLGILRGIAGYARDSLFNVAIYADDVAVGKGMG